MTYRIVLTLDYPVMDALRDAATKDLRTPKDQARYLLRQALLDEGLQNSKSATSKVFQAAQVDAFAGVNP